MKNKISLKINEKEKSIVAEIVDKKIWFKIDDETYSFDLLDLAAGKRKGAKSAGAAVDKISALMPGKVTKIFVSENQKISKGDALLVMEAMKMEYTFKTDIVGSVEKVLCKVGDQVNLGQLLIKLVETK